MKIYQVNNRHTFLIYINLIYAQMVNEISGCEKFNSEIIL